MQTIDVNISPALKARGPLAKRVEEHVSDVVTGIDIPTAKGEWEIELDERGRELVVLRVRDSFEGEASARFAPDELENKTHFLSRLHDLKGAVILVGGWRNELKAFYQLVQQWISTVTPPPYMVIENVTITEDRSGPYAVPLLRIVRSGQTVLLQPVARWVVGVEGRVDLVGTNGREILVLQGKEWFWVGDRPAARLQKLDGALFLRLLDSVLL